MIKSFDEFLNEANNNEAYFMAKTSKRVTVSNLFKTGEKVLMLKYDTDGYHVTVFGIYEIKKVNNKSIVVKDKEQFKFDEYGICVRRDKNVYRGNSSMYWVLYNKELMDDEDIRSLLNRGTSPWGFRFWNEGDAQEFRKCVEEIQGFAPETNSEPMVFGAKKLNKKIK